MPLFLTFSSAVQSSNGVTYCQILYEQKATYIYFKPAKSPGKIDSSMKINWLIHNFHYK